MQARTGIAVPLHVMSDRSLSALHDPLFICGCYETPSVLESSYVCILNEALRTINKELTSNMGLGRGNNNSSSPKCDTEPRTRINAMERSTVFKINMEIHLELVNCV